MFYFVLKILRIAFSFSIASLSFLSYSQEIYSVEQAQRFNKIDKVLDSAAYVDGYTGTFSSSVKDVWLPGNGGLDIQIYRKFDGAKVRSTIWRYTSAGGMLGDSGIPLDMSPDNMIAPGGGWTFSAAPSVTVFALMGTQSGDPDMSDDINHLCTGNSWYYPNGKYREIIGYSLVMPNGDKEPLFPVATGVVETRGGWRLTCSGGQGGVHTLRSPDGIKYTLGLKVVHLFNSVDNYENHAFEFMTTRQEDSNGNWIDYSYLQSPAPYARLISISASDGRQISLAYEEMTNRLSSITLQNGATWKYRYTTNAFAWDANLSEVELPNSDKWRYEYYQGSIFNNNVKLIGGLATHAQQNWALSGQMKKIEFPTGGSVAINYAPSEVWRTGWWWWEGSSLGIDYYYNEGANYAGEAFDVRASWGVRVTSKIYSNGDKWEYEYAPSKTNGVCDKNTVKSPNGNFIYSYIGEGYFLPSSAWSSNPYEAKFFTSQNTNSGWINTPLYQNVWKLGLLMSVDRGGLETETYTWDKVTRSEIWLATTTGKVGLRDEKTYMPVIADKTIVRNGATYKTTYSNYDLYGNPGTIVESGPNGGNRTTTLTYLNDTTKWIVGRLKDETFTGGSTLRSFDGNGNLLSLNKDGVTISYTYDVQGNLASRTLPGSQIYTYSGYKRGIPQSESQPEGVNINRVVDDIGNIVSETNGEGKTTSYTYDALNRVKSISYPLGAPKNITYTTTSKTIQRSDLVEITQYDGFGRPISINLGGIIKNFSYDAFGRKTYESNPGDTVGVSFQYDALGRITRIINADQTFQVHTYGAGSRTIIDERNKSTTYNYRSYGDPSEQLLMSIVAPEASANVIITRNARDLLSTISQGGLTRTYGYNSNYYLTSLQNPETGTTIYGRDAAGNMTSMQVGTAAPTTYTYDGRNRQKTITYPLGTPNVVKNYDKNDKLTSMNSTGGQRIYGYDANGNLEGEMLALNNGALTFVTGYAYNDKDQLISITYPRSERIVEYAPDVLGRPTKVGGFINSVSYWPSGQFKQLVYANGTVSNYGQNSRLWVSGFDTKKGSTAYLNSAYTFDGMGNLTNVADSTDSSYNRTLGYDGINRVTSASGPWGIGTIAYDGLGNIKSQVLGSTNLYYTYDSVSNRLNSVSGTRSGSYTYDENGNISTGLGNTYVYDSAPSLICVNCSNANTKVEYTYDGANKRTKVKKGGINSYEYYASNGNQLVEYTPSGAKLIEYIYLGTKRVAQIVTP